MSKRPASLRTQLQRKEQAYENLSVARRNLAADGVGQEHLQAIDDELRAMQDGY